MNELNNYAFTSEFNDALNEYKKSSPRTTTTPRHHDHRYRRTDDYRRYRDDTDEEDEKSATDVFRHEQNLIIREEGNTVLLSGCAHNGIVNILEHYVNKYGGLPTHVIGGFHLYRNNKKKIS